MPTPNVSFEVFPPRSIAASFRLWDAMHTLAPLNPGFVSVTYGAGGTTRKLTHEVVTTLSQATGLPVAAHLTCVGATKRDTLDIAQSYADAGVTDIVALRGDAPNGGTFTPAKDGFASTVDLIAALKDTGKFNIRVGAYPDPHPDASAPQDDIDHLKAKFDAGADSAITQFFFEAETFLRFRDACARAGVTQPIIPGILPVESWTTTAKFAKRCGALTPPWLHAAFAKAIRDDREALLATSVATELCSDLIREGVEDLHFYTLNTPGLTYDVCTALGIRAKPRLEQVA